MGAMTTASTQPVPRDAAKVLVRLPHALHEQVKVVAHEQGVSVNTLIATLLAGGVGFKEIPRERSEGDDMTMSTQTMLVQVLTDGGTDSREIVYHPGRCHMINYDYGRPNVFSMVPRWLCEQAGLRVCTNYGCRDK